MFSKTNLNNYINLAKKPFFSFLKNHQPKKSCDHLTNKKNKISNLQRRKLKIKSLKPTKNITSMSFMNKPLFFLEKSTW